MHHNVLIEIGSQIPNLAVMHTIKRKRKKELPIETQNLYQKQLYMVLLYPCSGELTLTINPNGL